MELHSDPNNKNYTYVKTTEKEYALLRNLTSISRELAIYLGILEVDYAEPPHGIKADENGELTTRWKNSKLQKTGAKLSALALKESTRPYTPTSFNSRVASEVQDMAWDISQHMDGLISSAFPVPEVPAENHAA
jgi:hypothetical protein